MQKIFTWLILILTVSLVLYDFVIINIISRKYFLRKDMTKEQIYTLSPRTISVLKRLDQTIQIYMTPFSGGPFFQDKALPHAWHKLTELLAEMKKHNDRIIYRNLEAINYETQEELRKVFQELTLNTIFIMTADKKQKKSIPIKELYRGDMQTGRIHEFLAEGAIIQSLTEMTQQGKVKVYYTVGHKELLVEDQRQDSFRLMKEHLATNENMEFLPIWLHNIKQIPNDCQLLLILSPRDPFSNDDVALIDDYLKRNGRLFMSIHPELYTNLEKLLLEQWGINPDKHQIIDRQSWNLDVAILPGFAPHKVSVGMVNRQITFPYACIVKASDKPPAANIRTTELVFTHPNCEAVYYIRQEGKEPEVKYIRDKRGFSVVVSSETVKTEEELHKEDIGEKKPTKLNPTRIVVWGSPFAVTAIHAFYTDQLIKDYFVNTVKWLIEKEEEIAIPSKTFREEPLKLKDADRNFVMIISLAVLPALGIILGIMTWFFRRK